MADVKVFDTGRVELDCSAICAAPTITPSALRRPRCRSDGTVRHLGLLQGGIGHGDQPLEVRVKHGDFGVEVLTSTSERFKPGEICLVK